MAIPLIKKAVRQRIFLKLVVGGPSGGGKTYGAIGVAKGLALDLAPAGITVNVVAPGWFESPLADEWMHNPKLSAAITGHSLLETRRRCLGLAAGQQQPGPARRRSPRPRWRAAYQRQATCRAARSCRRARG